LPARSCKSGQYSKPGANARAACFDSVFVIVSVNVPMGRPSFESVKTKFEGSLALATNRGLEFVSLDIIQAGDDPSTTTVTSRIAVPDAQTASTIAQSFQSAMLNVKFTDESLASPTLISLQVTACMPGYELLSPPSQTCRQCPSNYFCLGGSSSRQACAAGSFAPAGANTSNLCIPVVFVLVSVSLPVLLSNFTSVLQSNFQAALALTARVSFERVVIIAINENRRVASAESMVKSEIAADDSAAAATIRGRMDLTSLNANLVLQGLPKSSSLSASVTDVNSQSSLFSSAVSLATVLGASIGSFIFVILFIAAVSLLFKRLRQRARRTAFVTALRSANVGEPASNKYFPPHDKTTDFPGLQMRFTALRVVGKGSRGCVISATRTSAEQMRVAIKIILPKKDKFDEQERRRLQREGELLHLVTRRGCKSAVHAAESTLTPPLDYVCWFVMESLNGETLQAQVHPGDPQQGAAACPIGAIECIQVARDVLAALKVVHSERFVHCDVTIFNIIHLALGHGPYRYKLIDFGSAVKADEEWEVTELEGHIRSPVCRAPEMLVPYKAALEADIWSLGATMFELLSGHLPPLIRGGSAAEVSSEMYDRTSDVVDRLAGANGHSSSLSLNLAGVVSKALRRMPANRCVLSPPSCYAQT
jgi:tRNA A-37 threonylcarbamoyl transferase component Bud32